MRTKHMESMVNLIKEIMRQNPSWVTLGYNLVSLPKISTISQVQLFPTNI